MEQGVEVRIRVLDLTGCTHGQTRAFTPFRRFPFNSKRKRQRICSKTAYSCTVPVAGVTAKSQALLPADSLANTIYEVADAEFC